MKDMFKLGLLLNGVSAFHENLFEIRCGRIVGVVFNRFLSVTNVKISFVLFCFVAKSLVSVGELNFSQYFLNERYRVASFKVSFV